MVIISIVLIPLVFISCKGNGDEDAKKINPVSETAEVQRPLIIEVVGDTVSGLNSNSLIDVCKQNGIPAPAVYQWSNHFVIYDSIKEPENLLAKIVSKFPGSQVNVYNDIFYEFNRKKCENAQVANEWENILLTANLVKDPVLQNEYLDYHATQFEKWPEVAKGFCNAEFQQLLLFKNGRQLMLVISIPKGKSLDALNPKTTANNPRVDEWNAMMKRYQEGIFGTKPGEVWVFLKPAGR